MDDKGASTHPVNERTPLPPPSLSSSLPFSHVLAPHPSLKHPQKHKQTQRGAQYTQADMNSTGMGHTIFP